MSAQAQSEVHLPRVAIKFCTQCKWNLRAAYYAQELLQTFSTSIGEISLIPVTGGIFTVTIYHHDQPQQSQQSQQSSSSGGSQVESVQQGSVDIKATATEPLHPALTSSATDTAGSNTGSNGPFKSGVLETLLWDRKAEGGFPETKELKNRVRNIIEPDRNLGHIDRSLKKGGAQQQQSSEVTDLGKNVPDRAKVRDGQEEESGGDGKQRVEEVIAEQNAVGLSDRQTEVKKREDCEDCR